MTDQELSQAIHREVFGLEPSILAVKVRPRSNTKAEWHDYPNYSSDIAAAFEVVEKMRERGWMFDFDNITGTRENPYTARFFHEVKHWTESESVESDTAPRAICEAALSAVRSKK